MNIFVYGASSNIIDKYYISETERLGEAIARHGHSLVFGGGAHGVMGACARGAKKHNGYVLGISPSFFKVDGVLFEECDELIYTETMRERKQLLEDRSDAFIVAPGGIGTFEEFFEVFTLKQLARHNKPIVLFNPNGFYDGMLKLLSDAEEQGFIRHKTMELYECFTEPEEIINYIENYVPQEINIVETRACLNK